VAGHDAIAKDVLLGQPEFRCAMNDKGIQLDKRAWIQEQLDPLTSRQLAASMLHLDALRSPTEKGLGAHRPQARNPFVAS
jgi:hypothetical protein